MYKIRVESFKKYFLKNEVKNCCNHLLLLVHLCIVLLLWKRFISSYWAVILAHSKHLCAHVSILFYGTYVTFEIRKKFYLNKIAGVVPKHYGHVLWMLEAKWLAKNNMVFTFYGWQPRPKKNPMQAENVNNKTKYIINIA